jgi:uncharacterized membrane protein
MAPCLRTSALAVALGWPIALHFAVVSGHPGWMPIITSIAAICAIAIWSAAKGTIAAVIVGLGAAGLLAVIAIVAPSALVFGPPIVINAALGALFARSLRRGYEPTISVFARLEHGTLAPELARYTRGLTWLWTILFLGLATAALLLAVYASLSAWSWFVNCATYVAVAGLFVGEYLYRRIRFPQYRHASLLTQFRNVRTRMPWRSGPHHK